MNVLKKLQDNVGEVVILDLVNSAQVTTKIMESPELGLVKVGKLLVFQVSVEPANPMKQPDPVHNPLEHRVRNASYGYPLFDTEDGIELSIDHIIMVHDCHADMAKVYLQAVSGIAIAGANAISQLDAANSGR